MQLRLEKKLIPFLQSLSLKTLLSVFSGSFLLSTALSFVFAFILLPEDSRPKKVSAARDSLGITSGGLDPASEKIILERNIFNSEGTLGDAAESTPTKKKSPEGSLAKSDLPLKVKGIIFSGDPFNGLALLEDTQKRRTKSYVVGDRVVQNALIVEIYEDRVIFDRGGQREYIESEEFKLIRSRRKKGRSKSSSKVAKIATKPPPNTYKEDGFERQGNEIKLSEEFKRNLMTSDNMTKILQDAKAEPNMVNGELKGFRLTRIREASVYEKAGFQNNDVVEEINGIPLRDAAGAIRLLQQLKSAKDIEVRVNRGGGSMDMNITIQ